MSYCRCNETSDVYVFGSGKAIECIVAHKVAFSNGIKMTKHFDYDDDKYQAKYAMIGYLISLRNLGIRVPEHAMQRLIRECEDDFELS